MNDWKVRNMKTDDEWYVDSRAEAQERINDVAGLHDPDDFEIIPPSEDVEPDVVDHSEEATTDGGHNGVAVAETPDEDPRDPTPEELEEDPDIITSVDDLEQDDTSNSLDQLGESLDTDPLDIRTGLHDYPTSMGNRL